jgi:hypothetical protein
MVGLLVAVSAALAGCAPKTSVSATGNVPAQYQHVYMSVQEVWFNTSATAGPDDTTWARFPLTTPVTLDLAASVDGTLQSITTGLGLPIGTYSQVRLIPVDATATLLASAQSLGATYNSEVDYVDSAGTAQKVQLELQNPDKGIGVATSVQVKGQKTNVLSSPSSSTSSTTTPTTTTTPFLLAINIDGAKDLVPFTYGSSGSAYGIVTGMLLNPHISAYDSSAVGSVTGTLNIAGLTGLAVAGNTTLVNIQVTAESLSADGTRHVAVNSAPVHSDGTFTVYPLATTSSSPTSYDLVIHGPGIETIIVKAVAVNVPASSSTTPTPVSIGTLTPTAATSFAVNLTNTSPLPAGALVGFYQTVPANGEVPYLIEEEPIDPFSRIFYSDKAVSSGAIQYGTFSSGSVTLTSNNPAEGASTYRVAATAPLFADGVLTTTVAAATKNLPVPTLSVASGATSNTPTLTISQTTPGTYNQGTLIISHDGAIVATAVLDSILTTGATRSLAIPGIPGGGGTSGTFAPALYYVSVRVWNSGNPAQPLKREIYPAALDLRNGSLTAYSLAIN